MLGTILGVGSVIAMLSIGEGSKREAVEQIRQLGATNVIIRSVKPDANKDQDQQAASSTNTSQQMSRVLEYGLKYNDYDKLVAALPTVELAVPIALVRKNAQQGRFRIPNARILGTTPDYLKVKALAMMRGRFLTGPDVHRTTNVAVLGAGAARRLFSYQDPVGRSVLLGEQAYSVIGVLDAQDSGSARPGAVGQQDFNNDILIPITAAQRRFGELQMIVRSGGQDFERTQLSEITLTVADENIVSQTAAMARVLLEDSHPRADDFEIQVPLELLRRAEQEKRIWNIVLGSIAGISLLVGGIGIMNIMLATVTERTREIGIRRALGARRMDITAQFLVETIVLSATGGLLGVFLGITIPVVVSWSSDIKTALSWWSVLLAFAIAVLIGIVFGVYPARRAALMDPIEALRHD
ncbi:MAG: ABC transporter permease [Planctomycetales bacterium]|nr:ABC transporter permease [Planctomycetales bacterium]